MIDPRREPAWISSSGKKWAALDSLGAAAVRHG